MNANHMTIGFIGLGLIGGSIAKTIRRIHPDSIIYGFDTNTDSLKAAKEDGTLNQYFETLDSTFSSCDIIFLCAPVSNNIEYLKELKDIVSENCLLTDVGSVKEPIQTAIKELDMETNFIGGHPMVGSEKSGYAYANDHLLENAYYFLTPSERTLFQLTTKFSSFIQGLGALAVSLKPEEHDFITAAISHVPHIVAAELVHLVRRADRNNGCLLYTSTSATTVESCKALFTFILGVYVAGTEFITNICTFDSIKNITKKELIFPYKLMTWV